LALSGDHELTGGTATASPSPDTPVDVGAPDWRGGDVVGDPVGVAPPDATRLPGASEDPPVAEFGCDPEEDDGGGSAPGSAPGVGAECSPDTN
jgi:hypothetical protein